MKRKIAYSIPDVVPYINWLYFFHAWQMSGRTNAERNKLQEDAMALLEEMSGKYHTYAVFGLFEANGDCDDIVIGNVRIPFLRQQEPSAKESHTLCLADFLRPLSSGIKDRVGMFAATVDLSIETEYKEDDYWRMMAQTLADRLAEATAEKMHEEVRKVYWGYSPDEELSPKELHRELYQGIRPAVGYPSLPDMSINFLLSELIDMKSIGIRLTENGMMVPHASVSGFMFSHPLARYFDVGKIGEDQLRDYAMRRGIPKELMRKFLMSSLMK